MNNLHKNAIDQYIEDTIQVFQIWHNLCSELTSMVKTRFFMDFQLMDNLNMSAYM
jgi:hypothetical protein